MPKTIGEYTAAVESLTGLAPGVKSRLLQPFQPAPLQQPPKPVTPEPVAPVPATGVPVDPDELLRPDVSAAGVPVDPSELLAQDGPGVPVDPSELLQSPAAPDPLETRTIEDLAKDRSFDVFSYGADNPDRLKDQKKLDALSAISELRRREGLDWGYVTAGAIKAAPEAVKSILRGYVYALPKNLIGATFGTGDTAIKSAAKLAGGLETAAVETSSLARGGWNKLSDFATKLVTGEEPVKDINDARLRYFTELEYYKMHRGVTQGQGVLSKALAVDKDELEKMGVVLSQSDLTELEDLSEPLDPTNYVPLGAGVKGASKAVALMKNGKTLIVARDVGALERATAKINARFVRPAAELVDRGVSKAQELAGTAVGKTMEVTGKGTQLLSEGVGKSRPIGLGAGAMAVLGGSIDPITGVVAWAGAEAAKKTLDKLGKALERTGARTVRGDGVANWIVDYPLTGLAHGVVAVAPLAAAASTDEEAIGVAASGGLGAVGGAAAGVKSSVNARAGALARKAYDGLKFRNVESPAYDAGGNADVTALNALHEQQAARLNITEEGRQGLSFINQLRESTRGKVRMWLMPADEFAKRFGGSAHGFFTEKGEDGQMSVFLSEDATGAGHEIGHAVQALMKPEQRQAYHQAILDAYGEQGLQNFKTVYDYLAREIAGPLESGQVLDEMGAEQLSLALRGTPLDGGKKPLANKFWGIVGSVLEATGLYTPSVTGTAVGLPGMGGETALGMQPSPSVVRMGQRFLEEAGINAKDALTAELPAAPEVAPTVPGAGATPAGAAPAGPGGVPTTTGPSGTSTGRPAGSITPLTMPPNLRLTPEQEAAVQKGSLFDAAGWSQALADINADPTIPQEQKDRFNQLAELAKRQIGTGFGYFSVKEGVSPRRSARRVAQIEAYIREELAGQGVKASTRAMFGKNAVVYRPKVRKGKAGTANVNLLAFSPDKVLANAVMVLEDVHAKAPGLLQEVIPAGWTWEMRGDKPRFTAGGLDAIASDLEAYTRNHQNGFTGTGKPVQVPAGYQRYIPAPVPGFTPAVLPDQTAQAVNMLMGIEPPRTTIQRGEGAGTNPATGEKVTLPANLEAQLLFAENPNAFTSPVTPVPAGLAAATKKEAKLAPGEVPIFRKPAQGDRATKDRTLGEPIERGGKTFSPTELNPLRAKLTEAGLELDQTLNEAVEELNLEDIKTTPTVSASPIGAVSVPMVEGGFMPMAENLVAETTGPDGKQYKIRLDGYWEFKPGEKIPAITALEDLPGYILKDSSGMGSGLAKAGYTIPKEFSAMPAPLADPMGELLRISKMTSAEASQWGKDQIGEGGFTQRAIEIGDALRDIGLVKPAATVLDRLYESAVREVDAALAAEDVEGAIGASTKGQYFREAKERMLRTGSMQDSVSPGQQFMPKGKSLSDEIAKLKSGDSSGQTFNRDGSVWDPANEAGPVDVVTLTNTNVSLEDLTEDKVSSVLEPYAAVLRREGVVYGIFKISPTEVSIDINAVVPQTHRANTTEFAKQNGQQSIWDASKYETVDTGGNSTPVLVSAESIARAIPLLLRGEMPDGGIASLNVAATDFGAREKEAVKAVESAIPKRNANQPPELQAMPMTESEKFMRRRARENAAQIERDRKDLAGVDFSRYNVETEPREFKKTPDEPIEDSVGEDIKLVHYSGTPGLIELTPESMGKGKATPLDSRGVPKSFYFVAGSPLGGDKGQFTKGMIRYKATISGNDIYDARKNDPLGWRKNPDREAADESVLDKGFRGLRTISPDGRDVVTLFNRQAVTETGTKGAGTRAFMPLQDDRAAFKLREKSAPAKTIRAYKLFTARDGKLYPLFVGANSAIPAGVWVDATPGPAAPAAEGKRAQVKSKLGPLAFRPGWHAGDIPFASHIGVKDKSGNVYARRDNEVWAEVSLAADKDYQAQANEAGRNASGKIVAQKADLKEMPVDGSYRYKTNPNMSGQWIIAGSMKVNRVLPEAEVNAKLKEAGIAPMPWESGPLDLEALGFKDDGSFMPALVKPPEVKAKFNPKNFPADWSRNQAHAEYTRALQEEAKYLEEVFPESVPVQYQLEPRTKRVLLDKDKAPRTLIEQFDFAKAGNNRYGDESSAKAATAKLMADEFAANITDPKLSKALGWYKTATVLLSKVFGEDAKPFAQLLAATSPNTGVRENFQMALELYNRWKAGEFDELIRIYREKLSDPEAFRMEYIIGKLIDFDGTPEARQKKMRQMIRTTSVATAAKAFIEENQIFPVKPDGETLYGMHSFATMNVLVGNWLNVVEGPKTRNFYENLAGLGHKATIDKWAARTVNRLLKDGFEPRWRILPQSETGVSDPSFYYAQDIFQGAVDELHERGIAPPGLTAADLQAFMWFREKDLWTRRGWTESETAKSLSDFNIYLENLAVEGDRGLQVPRVVDRTVNQTAAILSRELERAAKSRGDKYAPPSEIEIRAIFQIAEPRTTPAAVDTIAPLVADRMNLLFQNKLNEAVKRAEETAAKKTAKAAGQLDLKL